MVQISETERGWKELTLKQMLPGSSVTSSCTACGKPVSPFLFSRDWVPSFSHLVICDNSVFLLTFPNGGDQSPSTKPHTHIHPLSGVPATLLLRPQDHSTSSGHGEESPLRASPTSETFFGSLMSVEGRLLVCLGWKPGPSEGACSVSEWTPSHIPLCFPQPIPVGIVYSRLIPKRTCSVFCLPPCPLCMPPTPTTSFPTEAPLRVSEAGGQTGLGLHYRLLSVPYNWTSYLTSLRL